MQGYNDDDETNAMTMGDGMGGCGSSSEVEADVDVLMVVSILKLQEYCEERGRLPSPRDQILMVRSMHEIEHNGGSEFDGI